MITEVREALATGLDAGLDGWQVSPYPLSSPTPPMVEIGRRAPLSYDRAFQAGVADLPLVVRALVPFSTDVGGQRKLDALLAPDAIKAVIESDTTLGGLVDDLHVSEVSGEQLFPRGGANYLGCEWSVRVLISNY